MTNASTMTVTFAGITLNALVSPEGSIRVPLHLVSLEGILSTTYIRNTYQTYTLFSNQQFVESISLKDAMEAIESV